MSEPAPSAAPDRRGSVLRLLAFVAVFVTVAAAVQLSGWNGPAQLQEAVRSAGWAAGLVFVLGYAVLVVVPTPASVLTISAGVLFGLWWGVLLAWLGAVLGGVGGFAVGRRLGRPAIERLLQGRLREADRVLGSHGLIAVLAVRLVPVFPYTPLNYAAGFLGVRLRDYVGGTAAGILPGTVAYVALGASGANPVGIAVGVTALVLLTLVGALFGRRLLARA